MKDKLENIIKTFIREYSQNPNTTTSWNEPLIAYADTFNEDFIKLKELVSPTHAMPHDFLSNAKTVVTYFIPFNGDIIKSNIAHKHSSKEWSIAYIETNKLIYDLNTFIKSELEKLGFNSNIIPATHNSDTQKLIVTGLIDMLQLLLGLVHLELTICLSLIKDVVDVLEAL